MARLAPLTQVYYLGPLYVGGPSGVPFILCFDRCFDRHDHKKAPCRSDALRHGCKEAFPSSYSCFSVMNRPPVGSAMGVRIESPLQRLRPHPPSH